MKKFCMVFVLNSDKTPLSPCHQAVARKLMKAGKAAVWRTYPFTIILKEQKEVSETSRVKYRLKIDYGSKTTGLAILLRDKVVWLGQIQHKTNIVESLKKRAAFRRRRRSANLRYRKCRFNRKTKEAGWIAPSLQSKVDNIRHWVNKLFTHCPITHISFEDCKFDMQKMMNPEISGLEYQQGTLHGYEVKEYLLEIFGRKCVYCGVSGVPKKSKNKIIKGAPLQVEHIIPSRRGGSDRISNLTIACAKCNQRKGSKTAEEFGYPDVQKQVLPSLKDAASVNITRKKVIALLENTGREVELGSGALTKYKRKINGLPKEHYYDASCVGISTPHKLVFLTDDILNIVAIGRGKHNRTNTDKYGFPKTYMPRRKDFFGFQTGDLVKAVVPKGKNKGTWYGRVTCRSSGSFTLDRKRSDGEKVGCNYKYIKLVQKTDGYSYQITQRGAGDTSQC